MKYFILILSFFLSSVVFADTYNAIHVVNYYYSSHTGYITATALCDSFDNSNYNYVVEGVHCKPYYVSGGGSAGIGFTYGYEDFYSCPYGGTVSGSNCINATCPVGQIRNTFTYQCEASCVPPETRNQYGDCYVQECLSYEVLNPTSGACQTPPTCGAYETYDSTNNICFLKKLGCPDHSHASTTNDQCLADAPLACPSGQHDDGTYTCVADDAVGCRKDQTTGYINGVLNCINPPKLDTMQQAAADAAKTAATTANNVANTAAQSLKDAANALSYAASNLNNAEFELSLDPTNTTKQQAVRVALDDYNTAHDNLSNATGEADKTAQQAEGANAQASAEAVSQTNSVLSSVDYNIKQATAGTGKSITTAIASTFDNALADTAISQAKTAFQNQWSTDKTALLSLFSFSTSATAALPTFDYGTIKGVHVVVDLNRYATPLSYIGLMVMFLAAFLSVRLFLE